MSKLTVPGAVSTTGATADVGAPALSVVVASSGDAALLELSLASLREQSERLAAELIVVREGDAAELDALALRHPYARFVAGATGARAAQLRAAGMRAANGDIVALTDDRRVAASDWLQEFVRCYVRSGGAGRGRDGIASGEG